MHMVASDARTWPSSSIWGIPFGGVSFQPVWAALPGQSNDEPSYEGMMTDNRITGLGVHAVVATPKHP